MTISKYSNNLTDFYAFIIFFFKKSLYNNQITRDEAEIIWIRYIGQVNKTTKHSNTIYEQKNSEFVTKLISYKDTEDGFVYKTLLAYLQDLKYSW